MCERRLRRRYSSGTGSAGGKLKPAIDKWFESCGVLRGRRASRSRQHRKQRLFREVSRWQVEFEWGRPIRKFRRSARGERNGGYHRACNGDGHEFVRARDVRSVRNICERRRFGRETARSVRARFFERER